MSRGHRARALAPVSERGPEWKPEPAQERESARQAGDLAALRRMLDASRGCFSLSLAVCNDRALRDQLIRQLTDAYPGIALVALPPQTPDVLQAVEARLGASTPAALFVLDLEASVPFQAASYPTLRALNAAREAWQRLACPVVFWLADYAAARVAAWAPDLWRYRSHQFDFASEQATPDRALGESFPGFDMVDGLPFEERRFRMVELEQRVREVGDPPAPELLAHALGRPHPNCWPMPWAGSMSWPTSTGMPTASLRQRTYSGGDWAGPSELMGPMTRARLPPSTTSPSCSRRLTA